jgi:hypothetical protein
MKTHSSSDFHFESEAEKIYRAIFRTRIPDVIKHRFMNASSLLNDRSNKEEVDKYYEAIGAINDLEALEVACRYLHKLPLLTRKLNIMVYVAETIPENQHFFINQKTSVLKGWWAFVNGGVQTAFKLGKGLLLLIKVKNA